MKLTGSAFEYYDGNSTEAEFKQLPDVVFLCYSVEFSEVFSQELKERAFKRLPSILEWFSYCYFFPSLLVGPPCGLRFGMFAFCVSLDGWFFREYLAFADRSMYESEPNKKIPSCLSFNGVGRKFLVTAQALIYHFLHAKFPVKYSTSAEFLHHSFVYR